MGKKALTRQTGLTTTKKANDYFVNKRFKIISGQRIGSIITVSNIGFGSPIYVYSKEFGVNQAWNDYMLEECPVDKKGIEDNIISLKNDKKNIDSSIKIEQSKLEYLKETKSKVYDENEFKAYTTLTLVEDETLSKIEKARLIASLIN